MKYDANNVLKKNNQCLIFRLCTLHFIKCRGKHTELVTKQEHHLRSHRKTFINGNNDLPAKLLCCHDFLKSTYGV